MGTIFNFDSVRMAVSASYTLLPAVGGGREEGDSQLSSAALRAVLSLDTQERQASVGKGF
jgi:hypothetical protein